MREQRSIMLDTDSDWPEEDPRTAEIGVHPHSRYRDALAKTVRSIYCICYREATGRKDYGTGRMPRWDGGEDAGGTRHKPVWPKIASTIIECEADPFSYIRAQFVGVRRADQPKPNQMHSPLAVSRWQQYQYQAKEALRRSVESDLNQIRTHVLPFTVNLKWETTKALDYVLRDSKCGASPLVRYIVAVRESLPIASAFRERALLQYMFQMADYDETLGDQIPQELKDEARQLRQMVAGQ